LFIELAIDLKKKILFVYFNEFFRLKLYIMLRSKNKPKIVIVSNLWCEILKIKKKKKKKKEKIFFIKKNKKNF